MRKMTYWDILEIAGAAAVHAAMSNDEIEIEDSVNAINEALKKFDYKEIGRLARKLSELPICSENNDVVVKPAGVKNVIRADRLNGLSDKIFRRRSDAERHVSCLLLGDQFKWVDIVDQSGCIDGIYYSINTTPEGYTVTFA